MATQIGQLKYSVGFDVKKQDLNALKTQLQQLKKLSLSDLMKINESDRAAATESFKQIREQAELVEKAIKDAFNVKLNTVNIETFNKSLKDSHTSLQQVYNTFKQGGVTGQNAFRSLITQVTTANTQLKQTHKFLDDIATTLGHTIQWKIASSAVNTLSNSIQQAWGYVKSLDTSLNDIMIVTGKSADQMSKFSEQANKAAASLGKTTVDYTKAALIYAQQGNGPKIFEANA